MRHKKLHNAKKKKDDEFYTRRCDIDKGLAEYQKQFKDKVIYCNCDDPKHSNFYKYFFDNFDKLKIKKLVATYYKHCDLFNFSKYQKPTCTWYDGKKETTTELKGDGDFRSDECIAILKQCDVVVTNPPFSLFREYFQQLVDYKKDFILVSHGLFMIHRNVFPFLKSGSVTTGMQLKKFEKKDKSVQEVNCIFISTLEGKKKKPLQLVKKYYGNEKKYPILDNYNAIYVEKIKDIPKDYGGYMAVPVSFFIKLENDQFKFVSLTGRTEKKNEIKPLKNSSNAIINGKHLFTRIIIRNKAPEKPKSIEGSNTQ